MRNIIKTTCLSFLLCSVSSYATNQDTEKNASKIIISPVEIHEPIIHQPDIPITPSVIEDKAGVNKPVTHSPLPTIVGEPIVGEPIPHQIILPNGAQVLPLNQSVIGSTRESNALTEKQLPKWRPSITCPQTLHEIDILRKALADIKEMRDKMDLVYSPTLPASNQPLGDCIGNDILRDLGCEFSEISMDNLHPYAVLGADFRHYAASSSWNVVNRGQFKLEHTYDFVQLRKQFCAYIDNMKSSAGDDQYINHDVTPLFIYGLIGSTRPLATKYHKYTRICDDISVIAPNLYIFERMIEADKCLDMRFWDDQEKARIAWKNIPEITKCRLMNFIIDLKANATTAVAISYAVAYMRAKNKELELLNRTDLPYPTFDVYETRGELFESIRTREDLKQALFKILTIKPEDIESALRVYSAHNITTSIINIFEDELNKFCTNHIFILDWVIDANLQYAVRRDSSVPYYVPPILLHSEIKQMSQYDIVKRCPFFI